MCDIPITTDIEIGTGQRHTHIWPNDFLKIAEAFQQSILFSANTAQTGYSYGKINKS